MNEAFVLLDDVWPGSILFSGLAGTIASAKRRKFPWV
jgi:hypothetical protein